MNIAMRLLMAVGLLSLALALVGPAAQAATKARDPSMRFQIMRASNVVCEPNCPQWIYAEGEIVQGTAARFNQVLRDAGAARLPLIVHSGGGDVRAAMAMGKTIRAHKMTVAVGRAFITHCTPTCDEIKKHKRVEPGFILSGNAYCASACTLLLSSGVQRMALDGSVIGTHQILNKPKFERIFYREKYLLINGHKKIISKTITKRVITEGKATTKMPAGFEKELRRYVLSMGIDASFMDFFAKAPPNAIYNMKAEERLKTHIVTLAWGPDTLAEASMCTGASPAPHCVLIKK